MNAESTRPRRKAGGGAMKKKGYSKGGKLKMVEKNGKKVPFFAADGVGKMAKGGSMKGAIKAGQKFKKPGESMEDMMIRVAKEQGVFKKKGGGPMKKKGYAKGGAVKVKSGDTLSQIAKKKGVTLKALLAANPSIKNANMIRVGQSIKIPGAAAGKAAKSKNPYAGMSQTQMNQLRSKSRAQQRAGTSGMRAQTSTTAKPSQAAKVKASKDGVASAMEKARARRAAAKKAPPKKKAAPSMSGLRSGDVAAKRGGMMKKKGYKKGGTVRGAGAATRGKRFGRSA